MSRPSNPAADAARPLERRRAVLIGLALLLCYGYFYYVGGNWNVNSRYAQVLALAEGRTLAIEGYRVQREPGDEAFFRGTTTVTS